VSDKEQTTFSDCLKDMQKKCSHPEVEECNGVRILTEYSLCVCVVGKC